MSMETGSVCWTWVWEPPVLRLVVTHGGKEGAFFPSPEAVSAHLLSLTTESRKQVEQLNQLVKLASSGNATVPDDTHRQVHL